VISQGYKFLSSENNDEYGNCQFTCMSFKKRGPFMQAVSQE